MKNIIITGASRGVGFGLTKRFLKEGHTVFAVSRSTARLKELSKEYPTTLKYVSFDLLNIDGISQLLENISSWSKIDVLFNNAGLLIKKPFKDLTPQDFEDTWRLNFLSPSLFIQKCLPQMIDTSHIVNISTMGAVQGSVKFPELTAYATSKAALINLTELLAVELGGKPCINAVALGSVDTEMFKEAFPSFQAGMSIDECVDYLYNFGMEGHKFQNGKTIQLTRTTP